jgi:hypothetical protein
MRRIARAHAEADDNCMRAVLVAVLFVLSAPVFAADAAAQAQLLRQQQSDAFALQLQQSLQSFRAGPLAPERRLELESLQRDQRLGQSDTFYRQQVQQAQPLATPAEGAYRRAELMRFEQERALELARAREAAAIAVDRSRPPPRPAPNPEPAIGWGPVLR